MKEFSLLLLKGLCAFSICTSGFTHAEELNAVAEARDLLIEVEKYTQAGERGAFDRDEAYARLEQEPTKKELQADAAALRQTKAAISINPNNELNATNAPLSKILPIPQAATFVKTSYPNVFHYPVVISDSGKKILFEDGSVWGIRDPGYVYNWLPTDAIIITVNREWFPGKYTFRLSNLNTGVSVAAQLTLFLAPPFHTSLNRRVVSVDDYTRSIYLDDGSVWSVRVGDYDDQFYYPNAEWLVGDTVIIGINDGWYSNDRPNILINANVLHTVRANCLNVFP